MSIWTVVFGGLFVAGGVWTFYESLRGTRYSWGPIPLSFWGSMVMALMGWAIATGAIPLSAL